MPDEFVLGQCEACEGYGATVVSSGWWPYRDEPDPGEEVECELCEGSGYDWQPAYPVECEDLVPLTPVELPHV